MKNKSLIMAKESAKSNHVKGNVSGFTLIELLVVISIIGFLAVASAVIFNIVRMNARDAVRVANISTIKRALAMYLNDSLTGYPHEPGACLSVSTGVGKILSDAKVLLDVPVDPLWPVTNPGKVTDGAAVEDSQNFCYYYFSNDTSLYKISFFLESTSKAGHAGINIATP